MSRQWKGVAEEERVRGARRASQRGRKGEEDGRRGECQPRRGRGNRSNMKRRLGCWRWPLEPLGRARTRTRDKGERSAAKDIRKGEVLQDNPKLLLFVDQSVR